MKRIKKMLFNNYKYILGSFFIITIIGVLIGKALNVIADMDSLSISSDAIVYIKDDHFNSGQAAAVTPTGKTIFVFFQQDGEDGTIGTHLTTLVILKKNSAGNYVEKARIKDLDCGHANGATYYKEGSDHYLLVATSAYPAENPATVIKYKMDLTNYKVLSQEKITLSNRINGIAWDNDKNRIIVAHMDSTSHSLVAYDTAFKKSEVIRKSGTTGASRKGGELGDFYNNQDIVYYNNKIYVVTAGSTKSTNPCNGFANANGFDASTFCTDQETILDNYLTVIDANTGDFSKTLFIGGEKLGKLMKNNNYYDNEKMREVEDILFIDGKMYIGVQKAGNYVITQITSSDSVVYSYNKLYVTYKLNGGRLAPNHGSNITASSDTILFNGEPKVVNGYTGENLISGGLYDYNDPSAINIEKDGYHIEKGSEWKSSDNKVYSQSKDYRVYSFADTSIKDATVTLLANWVANEYSISYNPNGGSGGGMPVTRCVYDRSCVLSKNTFTRPGYRFVGWTLNRDGTGNTYGDQVTVTNLTKNNNYTVTLFAKWEPINYRIIMYDNASTGRSYSANVRYGETFSLSKYMPSRSGYTLLGWSRNQNATAPMFSVTDNVSNLTTVSGETVALYAVWGKKQYTINFYSNGGSNVSSIVRSMNDKIGSLPNSVRPGYTFLGWFTSTSGGTQVNSNTIVTGNMTLYAHWSPISFNITYNPNGGTGTMAKQTITYGTSQRFNSNKFTRAGYDFVKWNTKADGSGTSFSDEQNIPMLTTTNGTTIELFAIWAVKGEYSITYNLDGGSLESYNPTSFDVETETFKLNNPSKEGYIFKGWTGSNGNTPTIDVYVNKGTTKNLNFKANYEAKKYKLTFKIGQEEKTLELSYGAKVSGLPNSSKKGYTFLGWFDETGEVLGETVGLGDKTYNPKHRPNKYKIKYEANGGSGEMPNQELTYDQKENLSSNQFTRENATFKGWSLQKDGKGKIFANEEEIVNLTDVDDDGIVLYAIWELAVDDKPSESNPKTGAFFNVFKIILIFMIGLGIYLIALKNIKIRRI